MLEKVLSAISIRIVPCSSQNGLDTKYIDKSAYAIRKRAFGIYIDHI